MTPFGATIESEITLLDYFAATLPEPSDSDISDQVHRDQSANPYNESHKPKLRSRQEIICDLRFERAAAMMKARQKHNHLN